MRWRLTAALAAFVLALAATPVVGQTATDAASAAQWRGVRLAGLFGESDEEKAARLQHENDQDAAISELRQRVHDLEQSLGQATGQNEQLSHRIQELSDRIDRQQKEFDFKLCALAAQQLGASASTNETGTGLPCDTSSALATLTAPGGQLQGSGPAPSSGGTLGTLPQGAQPQASSTKPQFDEALNMLAKARYDEARAAFRAFADANPKDPLAPQATYWVGDIAYVQKDYAGAAQTFAEYIKKFPTSSQAADSMLKLGQSLLALGQKKEGCLTLGAIKSKYRKAPESILSQAATAEAAACK